MLQVIAGLDAETLEAVAVAAPIQLQLLKRCLDGAGIQQPTAQDLLLRLAARLAQHLHQGAAIAALHANTRRFGAAILGPVQREPLHRRLAHLHLLLGTPQGQGIGLRLAFGIEYANVAQVRITGGKLQGHRHLQAIPGAFPSQGEGRLGAEVGRSVLGDRQWQ